MINLEILNSHKNAFGFFAQQLVYPQKGAFSPRMIEDLFDERDPAFQYVNAYWEKVQQYRLEEMQELYCQTFDFQKDATLYMTYFKFEDSKERGQMLAKLKVMYEMFGLEMPQEELSDFLPLICEFLYAAEWLGDSRAQDSFSILFSVLEDGTYNLLKALKEYNSPYYPLLLALRETLKTCVEREVAQHGHA